MLRKGNVLSFVVGICWLAASVALGPSAAQAQNDGRVGGTAAVQALASVNVGPDHGAASSKPYFVEFRARSAHSYGHTFLVHGRVGQKITKKDVIGLHPATESSVPWMIGHIIPVVSETGASDGDYEDRYIIARYRVLLTEAEYRKTLAMMRGMQRNHPVWHAVLYNCNRFVGDIAQNMGLRAPMNSLLMPKEYINALKSVNGGRSALSGSGASPRQQAAAAAKRQQSAKRQPAAANVRREANVRVDPRHD